jgi:hypothetical protein
LNNSMCTELLHSRQKIEEIWMYSESVVLEYLLQILIQKPPIPEVCITKTQFDFIVAFCADEIIFSQNIEK